MKVKIEVTQEDINAAIVALQEPDDFRCYLCPIGKALRRTMGFRLGAGQTRVLAPDGEVISPLPYRAMAFIQQFDKGGPV